MESQFKQQFDRLLERHDQDLKQQDQALREQKTTREQLEAGFRKMVQAEIIPAVNEVKKLVESKGWSCSLKEFSEGLSVEIELFQGNMKAAGFGTRPHLSIYVSPTSESISIFIASHQHPAGRLIDPVDVENITKSMVEHYLILLFQELVDEGPEKTAEAAWLAHPGWFTAHEKEEKLASRAFPDGFESRTDSKLVQPTERTSKLRRPLRPTMRLYAKPLLATLAVLLLMVAIIGAFLSRSFNDGVAAAQKGDYATALRLLRALIPLPLNAEAQLNLGIMYANGQGVPQDYARALKWFRLAAKQGDVRAQTNLGITYALGLGVPPDYTEAVKWYRLAADQGYAEAQSNLGAMYFRGTGVPQDSAEGVKWFRKAAEQGMAEAQSNLGIMYALGAGVQQEYAEAVKWYRLAAEQGSAEAQLNLGLMYANGEGIPQDYAEAVKWYRLAADISRGQGVPRPYHGSAEAQFNLGIMYANGQGVPQDDAEAVKWYRLAADQDYAEAQDMLGFMYIAGRGVPQDSAAAVNWYRLAADQDYARAQFNLGVMYANGKGVPRDYVQAHKWFNLSAAQGNADAAENRDIIELRMNTAQLAEAQSLAGEWKPHPARYCQGPGRAAELCRGDEVASQSGRAR